MSNAFSLATPSFEGPLEALLNLIEERKLSISDVSLANVTDAYLSYIEGLPELPLAETAQFILVASTLLLIKSRSLLPIFELSNEERESVEELQRRLNQYALVRRTAKLLRKEWGRRPLFLAKRAPQRPAIFSPAEAAPTTILSAAHTLIRSLPKPSAIIQAAVAPVLRLEDVVASLKSRLSTAFRTRFSELTRSRDKHEVIVYFLAMLELVRGGSASVTQDKLFSDITIEVEGAMGTPTYGV